MRSFMLYFLLFIIYSFIGWCMEMIVTSIENKKIVNRGFLLGPYCPVYGIGAISMLLLLSRYSDDFSVLFIYSVVICSVVEYITSYIMEKIFNARWWDYSNIPFNLNGRVCLSNSILFGIGGLLIMKVNPVICNLLNGFTDRTFGMLFGLLFGIFVVDFITTFNIINKLKLSTLELKRDNTDEITEKVKEALYAKSQQFKRLLQAFPDVKIYIKKYKKR